MHKKIKARRAVEKPHVKKDDQVVILAGDDKGKKGRVLSVNPEKGVAVVEGVNYVKRHTRPSKNIGKGGIVEKEGPVAIGKLGLLTPDGSKLTHAKIIKQGEEKNRVCVITNEPIGRK
ncbi:MAG: 50S ribosomal protein L24 [Erysipelotrichia bacterium]|nr:50S ribosomal protein L24 [Candidatus Riflebacteria bacterium]NCB37915.1 50S ribosomal protein L24 [Erysipelotrichia bacterium]